MTRSPLARGARNDVCRTSLYLFVIAALAAIALSESGRAAEPDHEGIVLGYYPAYERFDADRIPWEHLTHACHAFLTSDPKGRIETNRFVPNRKLTAAGAQHGVPVILSVGGWGDADGFEQATSTSEKMARWIDDVTRIIVENGYAGLDVDWEFPRDESTKNRFTQLVHALRAKFDELEKETGDHLLITSAVTARPKQGKWIDGPAMEPSIDFLNVMTYDFSGPWVKVAAHHAPLTSSPQDPEAAWRSTEQAMVYWEHTQGFPKHKLNVGIPLYGRKFPIQTPYGKVEGLPSGDFGTPEYKQIVRLQESGWMLWRDADAKAPWLVAPQGKVGVIAFDDPQSARAKGEWARAQGYRGIFFWAIGHDYLPDGKHHVLHSAVEGWSR